jgi:hypothetical protein
MIKYVYIVNKQYYYNVRNYSYANYKTKYDAGPTERLRQKWTLGHKL